VKFPTNESPHAPTAARVQSESGAHWYRANGEACYEVRAADGKRMRKTTLADARKLGLFPSVTTILSDVLAKPQLIAWIVEQACLAVVTTPKREGEETDAFIKRVLQIEKQQDAERDAAAAFGTLVHAALENALLAGAREAAADCDERVKLCANAVLALPLLAGRVVATERSIVGEGYAGKYDLEMSNEEPFLDLIDFKTAKTMPKTESWDEHHLQLAAYAQARAQQGGLGNKRIRCWNIYISTREPGIVLPIENDDWQTTYSEGFAPLVKHWQWRKQYNPRRK